MHIKSNQTKPKIWFVLANYSWAWGLLWGVVHIFRETPLDKTRIYFPSRSQLQTASWLGVGFCVDFISQHWDCLVWTCAGHMIVFVIQMCTSPVGSRRCCLLRVIPHLWLLKSFCLFFSYRSLSSEERGLMET